MLTINLQQIVDEINARRNRIRYQFQEIAMMLTEKLNDPRHKSLYMKIAKNEEQELIMDAMHYVLASPEAGGNLGALFMWKLKELKDRPILPITIRLETDGGYFKIGTVNQVTRGDMPLLIAGLNDFTEKACLNTKGITTKSELQSLPTQMVDFLKEFKRSPVIQLFDNWQWVGERKWQKGEIVKGVLKLGRPVLTKRFPTGRMPTV
jgi:hypothetical protein